MLGPVNLRTPLGPLLAALLVLATSAPALADGWSAPDPEGDVSGFTFDLEPEPCGTLTEVDGSDVAAVDITRLGVRHRRSDLRVRISLRDLSSVKNLDVTLSLRTPGADVDVVSFRWEGGVENFMMETIDFSELEPDECGFVIVVSETWDCPGLSSRIRPAIDRVTVIVPRACLDDPRWVRVAASVRGEVAQVSYSDYWAPRGPAPEVWRPTYGPRVRAAR